MTLAPEVDRDPGVDGISLKAADPVPSNPAIDKRANRLLDEAAVWGDQLTAMWVRLLKREQKVVTAKLRGSKAREGTRFWDPPPPDHETKEFKVGRFVDKARWLDELEDELRPILDRLYASYLKRGADLFTEEEKGKRQRRRNREAVAAEKARLAKLTADRITEARDYHEAWLDRLTEMADRIATQPNSTIDGLIDQIEVRYSNAEKEVEAVAHSQAIGATNEAQLEVVRSLGVKGKKVWWTAIDNRVRDTHKAVHGQKQDLDKPFKVGGASMDYPGDRSVPPGLWINCFPAGTLVGHAAVKGGYRRWYDGPMVTVRFASGNLLTGTPNHPMLTERGWVGLGQLHPGDHAIRCLLHEDGSTWGEPDVEQVPTRIEEVVAAALELGFLERAPDLLPNFHGDGGDGQVDVVRTNGELRLDGYASRLKPAEHLSFTASDVLESDLAGNRSTTQFVVAASGAPHSSMSGVSDGQALLRRHSAHADLVGLAPVARLDSDREQAWPDSSAADAKVFGERLLGHPVPVQLDEVVDVEVVAFHGWVYNLDTSTGWYSANGVVVHNCRCVLLFYPITTTGEPEVALEAASRWVSLQRNLERDITDWADRLETKGKKGPRKVRTPGGVERYDQPLGSVIVRDVLPLSRLGSRDNPWRTSSAKKAVDHLAAGDYVQLDRPKRAATLIKELRKVARDAEKKGERAPLFDLCKVTVRDTSLFCVKSHGIPRVQMPQLTGSPAPGSRADNLLRDAKGKVDLAPYFLEHLAKHGAIVHHDVELASRLIASQNELDGAKVGRMMRRIRRGEAVRELFVSDDNYIVDGHHHWAATVGLDVSNDIENEMYMRVARVDMGIIELLDLANGFAAEWGIAPRTVEEKAILRRVRTSEGVRRFHLPVGSPIVGGLPNVDPKTLAHARAQTAHLTEDQQLTSALRDWVMWDPAKQIRMAAGELTGTYDDPLSPQLYEDPDESQALEAFRHYGGPPPIDPDEEERQVAFSYVEFEAEARALLNALSSAPPHDGELWRHVNLPRDQQQIFDAALDEGHVDLPLEAVGDSEWFVDRFDRTRVPEHPEEPKHPKFASEEEEQEYWYWLHDPEAPAGWLAQQERDNRAAEFHVPVLFRVLSGARALQGDKHLYVDQNRGAWQEYITGGRFEVVSDAAELIPNGKGTQRVVTLRQTHTLLPGGGVVPTPIEEPVLVGAKAIFRRHVRTPAGVERYDQPLESLIVPDVVPRVRVARPLPPIRDFSAWGSERGSHIAAIHKTLDVTAFRRGLGPDDDWDLTDREQATLHAIYDFDDPTTGLSSRVSYITRVSDGRFRVNGIIIDRDGAEAGGFQKTLDVNTDPPSAFHGLVKLHDRHQGQGFGERLLRNEEDHYIALGVDHIDLLAGLDGGGYAWARAGFDWHRSPGAMRDPWFDVRRIIEQWLANPATDKNTRIQLGDILRRFNGEPADVPTPYEIAMLGHEAGRNQVERTDPAQYPLGKQILRGSEWEARKTLVPPLVLAGKALTDAELARARSLATAAEDWWEECQARGFDLGGDGLDWVPTDHPETKAVAVRHVRTPEGHALYGEEIGEIIRPDPSAFSLSNWDRLQDEAVANYTDAPSPRYWLRPDGMWIPVQWHEEAFPSEMRASGFTSGGYRPLADATNAVRVTIGYKEASINVFNPMTREQIDALSTISRPYVLVAPEGPDTGGQVRRLVGPLYPGMEDRGPTGSVDHESLRDALKWANDLLAGRVRHPSRLAEFKSGPIRHVRTPEGVAFYDQPLHSIIAPDVIPHVPTFTHRPEWDSNLDYQVQRNAEKRWTHSVRVGLSLGHLTQEEADQLGYRSSGHDSRESTRNGGWQPLPPVLYHVTTNASAVRAGGLKSRDELSQDSGAGLGGGESDTISFTTDEQLARSIHASILEMRQVARGEITPADMIEAARRGDRAREPFLTNFMSQTQTNWKPGDPIPFGVQALLDGRKYNNQIGSMSQFLSRTAAEIASDPKLGPDWTPVEETGIDTPEGRIYRLAWRPLTDVERVNGATNLFKTFLAWRAYHGGPPDPLFFSSDAGGLANVDPDEIQTLRFRPRPGTQGYPLGGMSEWRTVSGQAVELDDPEIKGIRYVRTPAGRERYGQPIDTPIVPHHPGTPTGQMMRRLAKEGGFTLHPTGVEPKTGYAVALDGHSSITPAVEFFSSEDHANEILKAWLRENAAIFDDPTWHIGGWYDRKHDEIVFDPSQVVPDLATARILGVNRNQQAIRDLANNIDIPTGGTGGREEKSSRGPGAAGHDPAGEEDLRDDRGGAGRLLPFDRVDDVRAGREEEGVLGVLARVVEIREAKAARAPSSTSVPSPDADNLYHLGRSHHTTGGRWFRHEEKRGPGHVRTPAGVRHYGLPLGSPITARHTPGALPHFAHSIVPTAAPMAVGRARWQAEHHLPARTIDYQTVMRDPQVGHQVALAYDAEPLRETEAIAHYQALAREVDEQFDYLTTTLGVKVDIVDHDPYATPEEMVTDVGNGHLAVLSTRSTGSHPYLTDEQNDRFRAVHDAFGHAATGRGFDRNGEEAAYRSHATMFSTKARAALFTETQGQNAWLIEHGAFPPQKLAVLPERFWNDAALELKAATIHHVRTQAGVERYDLPLKAPIVPHPEIPHRRAHAPIMDPTRTVGGRLSSSRPTDLAPAAAYIPGTNLVPMTPALIGDKAVPGLVARISGVPGFGDLAGRTDRAVLDEIIARQAANIVAAVDRSMALSPDATALHADWYPFAHRWLTDLAAENNVHPDAVFAATAALSPSSPWPDNVAWAQFMTRMIAHEDETTVPLAWVLAFHAKRVKSWEIAKAKIEREGRTYDTAFPAFPDHIAGKKLSELSDADAAIAIRGAHDSFGGGPGAVRQLGGRAGFGNPKNLTRPQSDDNMVKAISVLRNPSTANIDAQLGGNHKVRSFYSNLRTPLDTTYLEVTVDSHHYGMAHGHPWTSTGSVFLKSTAMGITHAPATGSTGALGAYPLVVEATRHAATIVNARYGTSWLPNQIQSIAWEQHKAEFPDSIRSNLAMQQGIEAAHAARARGEIVPAEEWLRVWEAMRGAGGPTDGELAVWYADDLAGRVRDTLTMMRKKAAKAEREAKQAAEKGVAA